MKIAILNNLYKPYQKGGAEKVTDRMVQELKSLGHDVFIITSKPKNSEKENKESKTYYINSDYYNLRKYKISYRLFWQISNLFDIKKALKIKKIIKTERTDLIITNNLMGLSYLSFWLIKNLNIKHVHILHDIQLLHPSGLIFYKKEKIIKTIWAKIYQNITKFLASSPNLIISPSVWLLKKHKKRNFFKNSKKIVLNNPTDFTAENLNKNIEENKKIFNFIFIGQIEEHKGIIFLIEAWKEMNNKNLILHIIGDGTKFNKCQKISTNSTNIIFYGKRNSEKIKERLKNSDALIVPSLCYENSPTVIYEASAYNIPIIASDLGGISELIRKYKGILFEANNSNDLINKIEYFCNNYEKYLLAKSDQIGEKEYSKKILLNLFN